jgi:hypothetical protein
MTIPTAWIFDGGRVCGEAGALAGAKFCDTPLESQIKGKSVVNDARSVKSLTVRLYIIFIGSSLSCLQQAVSGAAGGLDGNPRLRAIYCSDRDSLEGSSVSVSRNAIREGGQES